MMKSSPDNGDKNALSPVMPDSGKTATLTTTPRLPPLERPTPPKNDTATIHNFKVKITFDVPEDGE
eukprot:6239102-Ditylum_brightwellii.AAC.1